MARQRLLKPPLLYLCEPPSRAGAGNRGALRATAAKSTRLTLVHSEGGLKVYELNDQGTARADGI